MCGPRQYKFFVLGLAVALMAGCNTGTRHDTSQPRSTTGAPALPGGGLQTGPLVANILVDTNRDGTVSSDDEAGEDAWSTTKGAAFLNNNDDDDGDGNRDSEDATVNGPLDQEDMAKITILQASGVTAGTHRAELDIAPAIARGRVRIFDVVGGNEVFAPGAQNATIPVAALAAGDVELMIEAEQGRTQTWDGSLQLTLTIYDGNNPISQDTVAMRCAPVIFVDNTQPTDRVYVMEVVNFAPNPGLYGPLDSQRPAGIDLYTVVDNQYGGDRWVQDNMQQGYQSMPGVGGPVVRRSNFQLERGAGGLEDLVYDMTDTGPDIGWDFPGGTLTSHNYGGNLEVSPAYTNGADNYPLGRMLYGGGSAGTVNGNQLTETMTPAQVTWMDAQEIQGPCKEISSEWLYVGHIDEAFIFLPDGQGDWRLVFASADLGIQALRNLQQAGGGNSTVFAGRQSQTTVNGILNDAGLMQFCQQAQARLDSMEAELVAMMNIPASKIFYVPVLYEQYSAVGHGVALDPGNQNLVCLNAPGGATTLFIPDPEGPNDTSGTDVWQTQIRAAVQQGTGHNVVFVDVFESYHELLGEAHCGTNTERQPYATDWWTQ